VKQKKQLKTLIFKCTLKTFAQIFFFSSWSLFEFACIGVPLILCLTSFSDLLPCVLISLGILLAGVWASAHMKSNGAAERENDQERSSVRHPHLILTKI
jgi:hypothetical protein